MPVCGGGVGGSRRVYSVAERLTPRPNESAALRFDQRSAECLAKRVVGAASGERAQKGAYIRTERRRATAQAPCSMLANALVVCALVASPLVAALAHALATDDDAAAGGTQERLHQLPFRSVALRTLPRAPELPCLRRRPDGQRVRRARCCIRRPRSGTVVGAGQERGVQAGGAVGKAWVGGVARALEGVEEMEAAELINHVSLGGGGGGPVDEYHNQPQQRQRPARHTNQGRGGEGVAGQIG